MNLEQWLDHLAAQNSSRIQAWERLPAQPARYVQWPEVAAPLRQHLSARGIPRLYAHQAEAFHHAQAGRNVVVVTPTASGKTLCYNLPVLQRLLQQPGARALYLFPTKALAQDQSAELARWTEEARLQLGAFTYDGDTASEHRQRIRVSGDIVLTNPDMLHSGILPHHTKWVRLFENLAFVVIDELHQYRGVFGSHLANVIRRLQRVCRFYGSSPQFICTSATIANPAEHAERLLGAPVALVSQSGAPQGEKHVIVWNPPLVNEALGIRRSVQFETEDVAANLLGQDIPTIVFAKGRLSVELLLAGLRRRLGPGKAARIQGYRGGYLPNERRRIERGLREGTLTGVVATNALELGVDIGSLQAAVLAGYPGSVSSAWQQIGRAGRREGTSLAILVASSHPLDQYLAQHPEYFFGLPPESAYIHPDNLYLLANHLKCAAFELPFDAGERLGDTNVDDLLGFLTEERVLRRAGDRWFWMSQSFPAHAVSLRSAFDDNVVIIDTTSAVRVIGEVDRSSAPLLVHEEAIYFHNGRQYQVERLDLPEKKAFVREVAVDYYTDANLAVALKVLEAFAEREVAPLRLCHGEVAVTSRPTLFKKIKLDTHENVGWGPIHLPEETVHTTAFWLAIASAATAGRPTLEVQGALLGLGQALEAVAPLYLLCAPRDIRAWSEVKSPFTQQPTVYLYESVPGGIGFADKLYRMGEQLLARAHELVRDCPCSAGCPSCVGPVDVVGASGKAIVLALLEEVLARLDAA